MSGKRLLVVGDMVWGMADVSTPYVGQLVDKAGASSPQTQAMESASAASASDRSDGGATSKQGGCTMTINGVPVGHAQCVSVATPPLPEARPLGMVAGITLNGKPLLVEAGPFIASPSGSLASLCTTQQLVFCSKTVTTAEGETLEEAGLAGQSGPGAARGSFQTPSGEHIMASRTSTARLADLLPPEYAHLVGDPVDVATGAVVTWEVDDACPAYDLAFERRYVSQHADREGALGWGWSHTFEQSIWLEVGRVVLDDAGRQIEFDCCDLPGRVARAGDVLRDLTGRLELVCHGRNAWELRDGELTRHFLPMPGASGRDRDRGFSQLGTIVRPGLPLVELHYDDRARLSSIRADGKAVFSLRYDRDDRLESINDRVMRYTYSAAGDLIEAHRLDGGARKYTYVSHLLVSESNRRGGSFYYGYDGHDAAAKCVRTWGDGGRLHRVLSYESGATLVTDSLGERTMYTVSPIGLVLGVRDPLGASTRYTYDPQLRLVRVTGPDKSSARDLYDDDGRLVKHVDPDGATWRMEYDAQGRLLVGVDAVGGHWAFGYDIDGNLSRVEDPDHHVFRLEYTQGRLSKVVDPLGRVIEVEVGIADELLALRAPWQPGVRFEYDTFGRLTGCTTESGEEARWYYDASGQLVSAMRDDQIVHWRRDAEGSVVQQQRGDSLQTYQRDAFGRLLRVSGDDHEVVYRFDTEDRCVEAVCTDGPRLEFVRDACGRVTRYVVNRTVVTDVRRDVPGGTIGALACEGRIVEMTWDPRGRLLSCSDADGTRAYGYREDGLLTSFSTPALEGSLQRNAVGVVLEQSVGAHKVSSPDVDHRGDRYGLDVHEGISIFYLWSSLGTLERIGVVGECPFEIDLETSVDGARGVARHGEARAEYPTDIVASGRADQVVPAGTAVDALFRPWQSTSGAALIWDEDRLLCEGDAVHVFVLPANRRLATAHAQTVVFDGAAEASVSAAQIDRVVTACCLEAGELDAAPLQLTPSVFLRRSFERRVWNPRPRPRPGTVAWNPDDWMPPAIDPDVGETRLCRDALMRWLSPFPRRPLGVG